MCSGFRRNLVLLAFACLAISFSVSPSASCLYGPWNRGRILKSLL